MEKKKIEVPVVAMTAGLDIGNGDAKCKIKMDSDAPISVDLPSTVAYTTDANTPKTATDEYMADFTNNLEATVIGAGVKKADEGPWYFGKRAIDSGKSLTMFNITNHVPKSKDSLSTVLIDGIVASSALSKYYRDHKKLPKALNVAAGIGIALPINDYLDGRDEYKRRLETPYHIVTVRNFATPIQVTINYTSVVILAEGVAAQYAIRKMGPAFIQAALDRARKEGAQIDPAYTGELLAKAVNSLGVDIGDGTVNFPVMTNGRINGEASDSINQGYGTVLNDAVNDLINTEAQFDTRRDLSDFMRDPINRLMPANKSTYDLAARVINQHKLPLARSIRTKFTDIFSGIGRRLQVIWVYGGGATPMQKVLEPILISESKIGDNQNIPLLWMDSSYSRNLNRNGLYEAALHGVQQSLQG